MIINTAIVLAKTITPQKPRNPSDYSESTPPSWFNQGQNSTHIPQSGVILLYSQGYDNETGLRYAWLETNETGSRQNKTVFYLYNLNDSSTIKNISFDYKYNKTVWIRLPKNSNVLSATIKLKGYIHANSTLRTEDDTEDAWNFSLGKSPYDGTNSGNGTLFNASYEHDQNWTLPSYAECGYLSFPQPVVNCFVYENYTKPSFVEGVEIKAKGSCPRGCNIGPWRVYCWNYTNSSWLEVNQSSNWAGNWSGVNRTAQINLENNSGCWNGTTIMMRTFTYDNIANYSGLYEPNNGTIYESMVTWYNGSYPTNPYLNIGEDTGNNTTLDDTEDAWNFSLGKSPSSGQNSGNGTLFNASYEHDQNWALPSYAECGYLSFPQPVVNCFVMENYTIPYYAKGVEIKAKGSAPRGCNIETWKVFCWDYNTSSWLKVNESCYWAANWSGENRTAQITPQSNWGCWGDGVNTNNHTLMVRTFTYDNIANYSGLYEPNNGTIYETMVTWYNRLDQDNDTEWNYSGAYSGTQNASDFSKEINDYLLYCLPDSSGNCTIPLVIHSDTAGRVELSELNVTYLAGNYTKNFNAIKGSWVWSNFTWKNDSIPSGTTIEWRVNYQDRDGNRNATDFMTFKIKIPNVCNLTGLTNHTYGSTDTILCNCSGDGTAHLYRNGTVHDEWNNTPTTFGASYSNWTCNMTEGTNYASATKSLNQTISKFSTTVNLSLTPHSPITYETLSDVTCASTNAEADSKLYRNGVLVPVTNGTNYCYQESANVSTACGGLSTGSYNVTGSIWGNPSNMIDGDWGSYIYAQWENAYDLAVNYTKPSGSTNASLWQIADGAPYTIYNLSIPNNCWIQSPLQLRVHVASNDWNTYYQCWNGATWETIYTKGAMKWFYEEAMWWSLSNIEITYLPAGSWNYVCNVSATENYTSATNSSSYVVNAKNANVQVYPATQEQTYPYGTSQYCTDNSTFYDCKIYRDEIEIANNTNENLSAGTYNYKSNLTADTTNYTNYEATSTLTIDKGTLIGSISAPTVTYPSHLAAVATESNLGDSDVTYKIYCGPLSTSGLSGDFDLAAGSYGCIFNSTDGPFANYSANPSIDTTSPTVNKGTPIGSVSSSAGWTITYPTPTNISYAESNVGDNDCIYKLWRDSTDVSPSEMITLGAGNYNYKLNVSSCTNWTDTDNMDTHALTVNKASRSCTLSTDKTWNRTYDGTSSSTSCSVSAGSSDGSMTFTKNSSSVSTPDSQTNTGTFNYACQWTGGSNYSDCVQQTNTLTINKATSSCALTSSSGWTYTYPTSTTLQCACTGDGTAHLYVDNIQRDSWNATLMTFGAKVYSVVCNVTAGQNYNSATASNTLTVNKATPTGSQSSNPSWTVTYPTQTTVSCSLTNGDPGTSLTLKRDSVTVATGTSPSEIITLGYKSSGYTYTCEYPSTQNYSAATLDSDVLTVNKASRSCTLATDKNWNRTYDETASSTSCSVSAGSGDGTMTFTMNGGGVSSPDSKTNSGTYNYACQWTGGVNYSDCTQQTNTLTINKADRTCSLSTDKGWTRVYDGTPSSTTCTKSAGGGLMNFTKAGINITSPDSQTNSGSFAYTCQWTGDSNYNDCLQQFNTLAISKASSNCTLTSTNGWNYNYGSGTTLSCSCTGDGTTHLYFNNVLHDDYNGINIIFAANVGYPVMCNITQGTNYNSTTTSNILIINKATPLLSASVTTPITYGTGSNYAGSESNSVDSDCSYILLRNGVQISTGSSVSDNTILSAGNYNYTYHTTGCTNYTSGKDEKALIVNKAVPSGSLTSDKGWNIYSGVSVTIGYTESNSVDADVTYKVYRDNVDKGSGEIWTPPIGNYNYKLNTTGGANFSARDNMDTKTLIVSNKTPSTCSLSSSSGWTYTYPTSTTLQCTCVGDGVTHLYVDDVLRDSWNATSISLAANPSGYSVICNITEGPTYAPGTTSNTLIINRAIQTISVAPLTSVTYGTLVQTGCQRISGDSSSTLTLFRNGVQVAQGTTSPQNESAVVLAASTYNYTCTISQTQNYSANSSLNNYRTINKASPTFSTSVTSPITYGTASNYAGSESNSGDSDCTYILLRNGIQIASGSSVSDNAVLAVGAWNYTYHTTGCTNYTNNKDERLLTVNKASRTCTLATDKTWNRTYDGTASSTSCSVSAGSSDGSMTFTKNSSPVSTPDSQTNAGSFAYVCQWTGGSNYSDCVQQTNTLTINKATPILSASVTTPITYGTASDYSGSESNAGDAGCTYILLRNGVQIANGSSVLDSTVLGANNYNYTYHTTGCTNYNSNKIEKTLVVNKASPSGSLTSDKGWSATVGITVTIGYSESNSGDGDVVYKVWRDGVDKGSGETWTPPIGNYNYKLNTTGGQNYSSASSIDTKTLIVSSKIPANCTLTSSSGWNYNYSTSTTLQCACIGDGTTHLYVDNIQRDSWNATSIMLGAKTYSVICNITEGTLYSAGSASNTLVISKAVPVPNIIILPAETVTYPTQTTTTCSIPSINNEVSPLLFRNNSAVSNPDVATLSVGSYVYVCNNTATQNYTTSQTQKTLIVSAGATPPIITILSPQNITYVGSLVPLTFTIDKPTSWIGYSLDNQPNVTTAGNTSFNLINGGHNVIVYANESTGKMGSSNRVYFTVNVTSYPPWESVYAGSGGYPIIGLEVYNNKLYAFSHYVANVFDGTSWNVVNLPLSIPTSTVYAGKIYVGGQGSNGTIYSYDGSNWMNVLNMTGSYAKMLGNYSGKLYAGTMFGTPNLYVCSGSCDNPASWSIVSAFMSLNPCLDVIPGLCTISNYGTFNGKLYLNTGKNAFSFDGTTWKKVNSSSEFFLYDFFSDDSIGSVYPPEMYNSNYYVITKDSPNRCPMPSGTGFCGRVWKYNGTKWNVAFDYPEYNLFDLEVYNGRLYVGTANKIYVYDGSSWQLSYNSSLSAEYALVLKTWNSKIYVGFGNGVVAKDDMLEPLNLTLISPQNTTYSSSSVPLTFATNRPVSWIGYSLDNQPNVTITGNITLNVANGAHNIILYAKDALENMVSSRVYFTVTIPTCSCTAWKKSGCEDDGSCTFCYWTRTCTPPQCLIEYRQSKACQ